MGINLGGTQVSDIRLGNTQVSKIYLGSTEVWSAGGGGGTATDWGVIGYYSVFSREYAVQDAMMCTVSNINQSTLEAYVAQQGGDDYVTFRYDESMGGWQFGWESEDVITTEDMPATTGITVTLDEGASFAEINIVKATEVDPTSAVTRVELTQNEYNNLVGAETYTIHGSDIPREAIKEFSFGRLATTTPRSFLSSSNVSSLDFTYADSLTSISASFLSACLEFNQPLILPNTVTSIGANFMENCSSFNQSITLPSNLVSIGTRFLYSCMTFNQPLVLPGTITSIDWGFLQSCDKYTSVVDLGSLRSSVLTGSSYYMNYFSTSFSTADSYRIGITIRGTYASDWKSVLPDSTTYPYRKLIIGV